MDKTRDKKQRSFSEQERKVIRARGNPYWKIQARDEGEANNPTEAQRRAYLRKLENPHAFYAVMGEGAESSSVQSNGTEEERTKAQLPGVSKTEFQRRCRSVFAQYIPEIEKGRIRTHHRQFIVRNEGASPLRRARLLAGLEKYDLSKVQGLSPQFNRERDVLTESKLRALERATDEGSVE